MKRKIIIWEIFGFISVSISGTILHFLYDWSGSVLTALVSGVNESTWEHMKLLFVPMFLFAIVQSSYVEKKYNNFWCIKLKGTLLGLMLIPTIFYTINGIFGTTPAWVNITIFFVSAGAAFLCEIIQFTKISVPRKANEAALALLCILAILFLVFTFTPPRIPLFRDPVNGGYGLMKG